MANPNAPFGFAPADAYTATCVRPYSIATGANATIAVGDPVKLLDTGTVALAAAGDRPIGVCQGVNYTGSDGKPVYGYWPASTAASDAVCMVAEFRPGTRWAIQAASAAAADVGLLADHVAGTASTTYNRSTAYLNSGSTSAASFRILGLSPLPRGNEPNAWGSYAVVIVEPYETEFSIDEPSTPGV